MSTIPVAVIGASGYTGAELLRILAEHPQAHVVAAVAKTKAGESLARVFPQFAGTPTGALPLEAFDADAIARRARVAFSALPHGESAPTVAALLERGLTVIDLSADFRLRDPATYATWYHAHPAPNLLPQAVYGLPERHRARLVGAGLVAAPGCYPTATILAIAPLLDARLVSPEAIVVDAKSGVSGVGRTPGLAYHFPEAAEGIRAYKIAGTHRHTPEIEQELSLAAATDVRLTFTPHLVPMSRGILSCVYALPTDPARTLSAYHEALVARYEGEPFVTVLPPGESPDTAFVRGSNRAHVSVAYDARARRVIAMAAIDNLVKGASGQAVQCMNLALGLPETAGLGGFALFP
jgi:N-acetyl-gamma-glutamyl-phosphate reductase